MAVVRVFDLHKYDFHKNGQCTVNMTVAVMQYSLCFDGICAGDVGHGEMCANIVVW